MTQLDFTKPLALASDPYTAIPGPFIGPDEDGHMLTVIAGCTYWWDVFGNNVSGIVQNLVLLQEQVPKWRTGCATYYPNRKPDEDKWGAVWPTAGDIPRSHQTKESVLVNVIEISAAAGLAAAIEDTVRALAVTGQKLPALSKALNSYRERL